MKIRLGERLPNTEFFYLDTNFNVKKIKRSLLQPKKEKRENVKNLKMRISQIFNSDLLINS